VRVWGNVVVKQLGNELSCVAVRRFVEKRHVYSIYTLNKTNAGDLECCDCFDYISFGILLESPFSSF
jgi:hypothetical protein